MAAPGNLVIYSEKAVATFPLVGQGGKTALAPIQYGQVRVNLFGPGNIPAQVYDMNGNPLSITGGNFGQVTTGVTGQFSFQVLPGTYTIQVAPSNSNTPQLTYSISIGDGGVVPLNGAESFLLTVNVAATTWTAVHNFGTQAIDVTCYDTNWNEIVPDNVQNTDTTSTVATFLEPQAGFMVVLNVGNWTPSVANPNNIIGNPTSSQSIAGDFPLTIGGSFSAKRLENVRLIDPPNNQGWTGSNIAAWLATAATDLGSGGTIKIASGSYTLTSQLSFASNITYEFDPQAIITASASYAGTVLADFSNLSNVRVIGGIFDGNRANNTNIFEGLYCTGSTKIAILGTVVRNFRGSGINIAVGSSFVAVERCEVYNNGPAIPAADHFNISISPGVGALSHVRITNCNIHDGNTGIAVVNAIDASLVEDINISGCDVHHNANDGILVTAANATGGLLRGVRVENNAVYINGWPANGAGFPSAYTPGFLQTGAISSTGGSGIDFISNGDRLVMDCICAGNRAHDNQYDGFDASYNPTTTVNTSGTTVTWVSGVKFNTAWHANQVVIINGPSYKIASVASATSLTLASTAGTQTGVQFQGSSQMGITFVGNTAYNNGNLNIIPGTGVGLGFYSQFADSVVYQGNLAYNNNFEGFELYHCNFNTFSGDNAYNNNTGNTAGKTQGFVIDAGLNNCLMAVSADDLTASPKQTIGVNVKTNSTGTVIVSPSLYGSTAPVSDSGTSTFVTIGNVYGFTTPKFTNLSSSNPFVFSNGTNGGQFDIESNNLVMRDISGGDSWWFLGQPVTGGGNVLNLLGGSSLPGNSVVNINGVVSINGTAPTVAAGKVGLGSITATSATAGANGAVPAQVVGYLIINVAGTNVKVPYFAV